MNLAIVCPVIEERNRMLEQHLLPLFRAKEVFNDPNTNLFSIDGSALHLPAVRWGRDFEITLLLDTQNPATFRKFVTALPKRFSSELSFWGNYIEVLTKEFCRAFDVRLAKIRFSQISVDQCSLFHSDFVKVRLFQTLRGPGTEYVSNENLKRDGLGQGCNSKIVIDPNRVQHAREHDILLMRGDKWLAGKGLVHRSPPIEELGIKRLYICLDAVE